MIRTVLNLTINTLKYIVVQFLNISESLLSVRLPFATTSWDRLLSALTKTAHPLPHRLSFPAFGGKVLSVSEAERGLRRAVESAPFLSLRDIFPPWGARNPGYGSSRAFQSKATTVSKPTILSRLWERWRTSVNRKGGFSSLRFFTSFRMTVDVFHFNI